MSITMPNYNILYSFMLQFCQQSKTKPKDLLPLIQNNLGNSSLLPLITEPEFLSSIDLHLTSIGDCQFFIKNVLGRMREPRQQELVILEEYVVITKEAHLKELARMLIERSRVEEMNIGWFLTKIQDEIGKSESKELKYVLGRSIPASFDPCKELISFLVEVQEAQPWDNHKYTDKLVDLMHHAFIKLDAHAQHTKQYIAIVARLLRQTVTEDQHWALLMLTIHDIMPKHWEYAASIVQRIDAVDDKPFPDGFLSRAIFFLFTKQFRNEVYFDPTKEEILQPLPKLARQLFKPLNSTISIAHLGWVSILALDQLVLIDNFQKELHICASLLRQRWFHQSQLLSQCLCYIIVGFFQGCTITGSLPTLEGILGILTAKELKYVVLKLGGVLSEGKKLKIIEECMRECGTNMKVLLYHFLSEKKSQELGGLEQIMRERYLDLMIEVEQSRYNSYQKQLNHFIELYNFIVSQDLSSFPLTKRPALRSLLTFYKHLLKQDYLAEQFWLNLEKASIFTTNTCNQCIEIACEFIKDEKVFNLSGAMLVTAIANGLPSIPSTDLTSEVIDALGEVCLQSLKNDVFPSNVRLSLQFIAAVVNVKPREMLRKSLLVHLGGKNILQLLKQEPYGRLHYLVESITLNLLKKKASQLKTYKHLLPFYAQHITGCQPLSYFNEHIQRIHPHYSQLGLTESSTSFTVAELSSRFKLKDNICNNFAIEHFRRQIGAIKDQFRFWSPIYREEIVTLTYIKHSAQDNYYFKNHFNIFILMEYARILARIDKKFTNPLFIDELYQIAINTLGEILKGDTLSHSRTFYQALVQSQIVYTLLTQPFLQVIHPQQLTIVIQLCLDIIQKENYPLLRQQIEAVLCRAYLELNSKEPSNLMKQRFIAMLKVNINSGIPLALTLGYELLRSQKSQAEGAIISIHQVLVKFISCHTAYLRAICQYYLHTYLQSRPQSDPFLISISNYWRDDKDSQKILKNVAIVIEGFKEAVQGHKDFIGFERVEEYASNRVKLEIYRSLSVFYSEDIVGEINRHKNTDNYLFQGFCYAVTDRCSQVKLKYLQILSIIQKNPEEAVVKSNMKCKNEQKEGVIEDKPAKQTKQYSKKKHQGKNKRKIEQAQPMAIQQIQQQVQPSSRYHFYQQLQLYNNLEFISHWHRKDLNPTIIVIATLLEKVHNFGHILRTLHKQNAWLVVPSQLPLMHPQCTELIPADCDVPILEIKQRDVHKFILLMKSLGYPLVALEQCSRSVQIESAAFPDKFMLLLGNERLGAPGWLLDEGDLLVQIPQVGKIRSLNVHVSMVLCVWQYLTQSK